MLESAIQKVNLKQHGSKYANKNILIEFSSPNIAKPFTIGHLRSTIIGSALANLLEETGSKVFRDNHLGDWGTQFGKQIYAIKKWGDEKKIENSENPVKELVSLYVKFHDESEKDPKIEEEGRKWFKKLESNDQEARRLWEKCVNWSRAEFENIYHKLDVNFTENSGQGFGESFFEDKMQAVVDELKSKKMLKKSQDAELVFFKNNKMPPLMILKQDGATLYATRDLATDKFRLENPEYGHDIIIINEVGAEQSLYFKQIYELENMLGWTKPHQRIHIGHGMYRFKDKKMSTRKGNTIWLKDVLEEAERRSMALNKHNNYFEKNEVLSKNNKYSDSAKAKVMDLSKQVNTSEIIGISAIKWNDLKRSPHLDIVFDWDEILSMQGNSGPYMQYTYVRCYSILSKTDELKKYKSEISNLNLKLSNLSENTQEMLILRTLFKFEEIVSDSANKMQLHDICTYLYDLAQKYNAFYQKTPILKEEDRNLRLIKLIITEKTAEVINIGLRILGIKTIKAM